MAETLTPNSTTTHPQHPSLSSRILSPTPVTPLHLGSNDDQLERAAARASRAASIRRKGVELVPPSRSSLSSHSCLNSDQIIDLFRNCVKLACENKINEKNTWELKLIDHLSEIINVEGLDNSHTNFQKACCTLEAGVKIYAVRVDAWHADAYRVLGSINRAAPEDEKEKSVGEDANCSVKRIVKPKMEIHKKISPLSTVESSFEAFNAKKFDVVFSVDPLYHQTSLQFDEGGAKGLLLYNLGVYGGCQVLFDSLEKPTKFMSRGSDSAKFDLIDISFARECIEELVTNIHKEQPICPTLTDITNQLNECSFPSRKFEASDSFKDISSANYHENVLGSEAVLDMDDPVMQNFDEEQAPFMSYEHANDGKIDNISSLLLQSLRSSSIQSGWTGAYHWKYKNPKGSRSVSTHDGGQDSAIAMPKSLKTTELDIEFSSLVDVEKRDIFLPAKHPESLLLIQTKNPPSNTFPESCHYQLEDLVKLFLLPNIMCLGPKRRIVSGIDTMQSTNGGDNTLPSSSDQDSVDGYDDDRCIQSDVEYDVMVVPQPSQVNKIEVQYDKTSKQVDIQMLKETIWNHMQESIQKPVMVMCRNGISFRNMLATFPEDLQVTDFHDVSPHLCFVCILHLANEHGLTIQGFPNMDDLSINIPVASQDMPQVIHASL